MTKKQVINISKNYLIDLGMNPVYIKYLSLKNSYPVFKKIIKKNIDGIHYVFSKNELMNEIDDLVKKLLI